MKIFYPAIIHKEDDNYWVEFPDLDGCHTYGETLTETLEYAEEALEGYALTILEEGQKLPSPGNVKDIQTDDDSFVTLIGAELIDYNKSKAVKKTLTIPEWLNSAAEKENVNFSQTLQNALMQQLHISQ